MSKFLKKYWFVGLVVLLFVCAIGYYIYDTNKDKLRGKSSGGEDVVYSINGQDKTVSAFYDDLYKASGASTATQLFEMAVADESAETTDDMTRRPSSTAPSARPSRRPASNWRTAPCTS